MENSKFYELSEKFQLDFIAFDQFLCVIIVQQLARTLEKISNFFCTCGCENRSEWNFGRIKVEDLFDVKCPMYIELTMAGYASGSTGISIYGPSFVHGDISWLGAFSKPQSPWLACWFPARARGMFNAIDAAAVLYNIQARRNIQLPRLPRTGFERSERESRLLSLLPPPP